MKKALFLLLTVVVVATLVAIVAPIMQNSIGQMGSINTALQGVIH